MEFSAVERNQLARFVEESNRIEGITRTLTTEIDAHQIMLGLDKITIADLIDFVSVIQPNARFRDLPGLDVRVGDHIPPRGGPEIRREVDAFLADIYRGARYWGDPYHAHQTYEAIHPFTDGNGRSGRAIWLWQMSRTPVNRGRAFGLGFLHAWYYQSLDAER